MVHVEKVAKQDVEGLVGVAADVGVWDKLAETAGAVEVWLDGVSQRCGPLDVQVGLGSSFAQVLRVGCVVVDEGGGEVGLGDEVGIKVLNELLKVRIVGILAKVAGDTKLWGLVDYAGGKVGSEGLVGVVVQRSETVWQLKKRRQRRRRRRSSGIVSHVYES